MTKGKNRLIEQAERLRTTGQIFLDIIPGAKETGVAKDVDKIWYTEDGLLPEYKNPTPEEMPFAQHNLVENERMRAMPTSIDHTTTYSVRKGQEPEGVEIVISSRRVDLGYKIPTISFDTGSEEGDRQAAAQFLTQNLRSLQNRTPQEKKEDEWNKAIRSSVLADTSTILKFEPTAIQAGRIVVEQHDHVTGLSSQSEIDLTKPKKLDEDTRSELTSMDFNLIRNLQSKLPVVEPPVAGRIQGVINNFLGKK